MRIAFVVGKFPKLSKTFILSQITGLLDLGHAVDIYATASFQDDQKLHSDVEKYQLQKTIFYLPTIPGNSLKKLILAFLGFSTAVFSRPHLVRPLMGMLSRRLKSWQAAWIYSSLPQLQTSIYDIIHCHFAENSDDALYIQAINSPQAKIVITFHGYDVNVTTEKCSADAYKAIFKQADLFTANTSFTAKKASLLGCPPEKIEILPVGLKVERYPFQPRILDPGETVRILTVGRLVEKKGIEYTLQAIAMIRKLEPDISIHYSIIGEGELRKTLQDLALSLGIAEAVTFLGAMTQEEVRRIYAATHIFILSSVTAANGDMEGQGLVLQEAQCVGLPVISTLHNGIPDGVIDGETGFLVPEKDVDALAGKIRYLIHNSHLWPEIGEAGHRFVAGKYDIDRLNERLVELYESTLI